MRHLPDILDGCKIFPCSPGTKDPATPNGWKDASSDPAKIAAWLAVNPEFNWGVACGLSGLFVFDVDPAGLDWWAKLIERDPVIKQAVDAAFQVRTPKGGLHVYFKGEGPSTASRIAEGIDTRGGLLRGDKIISGGYVVLPGSRTKAGPGRVDGSYVALPGGIIAPLPDFMAAIVPERKKTDTLGLLRNPDSDLPANVKWATDLLKNYVQSGRVAVQGRGGNNLTFEVAASILDKAISPAMCFDLLWQNWNGQCSPPWDDWELEQIIKNALEHGEDTASGVKGVQSNDAAFEAFKGLEFEPPAPVERARDRIMALHDFADNAQDPTWLIPGVLPSQGVGMLYGDSGSYKSFLALDMALCVAFGIPGQWGAPPVKNDVLFMAGEGPNATAKMRWPSWMEWQGTADRKDHRFFIKDRVPFYTDAEAWQNVRTDLAELNVKPSLIVIDTLARLNTGMDENSSKDMQLVIHFAEELSRYYECCVVVIHHTGKDQSKGARGSSALYAGCDFAIYTKKTEFGTTMKIKKQKDADVSDDVRYFIQKEFGKSIVLDQTDTPPADRIETSQTSRYAWASQEEVVKLIQSLGGECGSRTLEQEIASLHGIETSLVRKQLNNSALAWLRPTRDTWKIPGLEYDL